MVEPRSAARRTSRRALGALRGMVGVERLVIALRAAVAATAAWFLGNLLPGELGDYAYYAPFGAVIAMTPSVMSSIRSTVQTVIGLALGIALAWTLLLVQAPALLSVPAAVGLGTLLAGALRSGPARDYVPIAALFVLVIGGADANDFSAGYLVQVALGMTIGVLATVLVMPPMRTGSAAAGIARLRAEAAGTLRQLASIVQAPGGEPDALTGPVRRLRTATDRAADAVSEARDSRRANPRTRWSRYDLAEDDDDLDSLRRIVRHLADLVDLLHDPSLLSALRSPAVTSALAEELDGLAELADAWGARTPSGQRAEQLEQGTTVIERALRDAVGDDDERRRREVAVYLIERIRAELTARAAASDRKREVR